MNQVAEMNDVYGYPRWTHLSRQFLEIFKLHFGVYAFDSMCVRE